MKTKVVGLTGGIASGKSTVSAMLKKLGAVIIDADLAARQIVEPGKKAWQKIRDTFKGEYFHQDGTLNRAKLGELVFADSQALAKLNEITHPLIIEEIGRQTETWKTGKCQPPLLVIDAPLLIETGLHLGVDEVWLVSCSQEEQIKRLRERDNLSYQEAVRRIAAQMPLAEKRKYAQQVIDNSTSLEETEQQVRELWRGILHKD